MGNSLQDQLLTSGLIDKKKLKKAQAEQRRKNRVKSKGEVAGAAADHESRSELEKHKRRDRELNLERKQIQDEKAVAAQVRELITSNRLRLDPGEIAYHFVDRGVIKKLHITQSTKEKITRGDLSIVRLDDRYEIVPLAVAQKILSRDDKCVIVCKVTENSEIEEEESYPDHQVPDDLIW